MKSYRRYNYFLIKDEKGLRIEAHAGMLFSRDIRQKAYLGAWYAHENAPYINDNGEVVRNRYKKQVPVRVVWGK